MIHTHQQNPMDRKRAYKIVMAGDSGVGKTSLFTRFSEDAFNPNMPSTYATKMSRCEIRVDDDKPRPSMIWDTAGQERNMSCPDAYFRGAECMIIVYSLTDRETFMNVSRWMQYHRDNCDKASIILVANKCDLCAAQQVTEDEGRALADDICAFDFIFASALSGGNVVKIFETAIHSIETKYPDEMPRPRPRSHAIIERAEILTNSRNLSPAARVYTTCCGDARELRLSDEERARGSELIVLN